MFHVNLSFFGKGFVGIHIDWKGVGYNLINVYTLCNRAYSFLLWNDLINLKKAKRNKEWCVVGDFNEVMRK